MKKVVTQNKQVLIVEEDVPKIKPSYLLVKTLYSVISPGTELSIIQNDSTSATALGYSAMGTVIDSSDVENIRKGDLVACYGAPYVHHGEYLLVPKTLAAKVPTHVEPKEAALAGIGAIAIHALRVSKLELGETIVIVGLGLLGQMIAKIADAAAYNVITLDSSEERANMISNNTSVHSFSSIEKMEEKIKSTTHGNGADAVLICTGGKRSEITHESLKWIRNKGKVVIVGDVEPEFPRNLMFSKEAQILISRAGGPGRYDPVYERNAIDYPYGFIRWTEGRNIEEYIRLVSEKRIDVSPFLTEEVLFENVAGEFEDLLNKKSAVLTKIIHYPN